MRLAPLLTAAACLLLVVSPTAGHDIPNERVDRSIQAVVQPGAIRVDYEVSLAELTLAQDLRRLVGEVPGADREALFRRYGDLTAPLNARGLMLTVDGEPFDLRCFGFDLVIEDHPRYTFHLSAPLPPRGRLRLLDTNYAESQGTSRLAIRAERGSVVRGDDLPTDVESIAIRPTWMLTEAERERTRRVDVDFEAAPATAEVRKAPTVPTRTAPPKTNPAPRPSGGLTRLLDRASGASLVVAWLVAFGLGAAHAIQPGHGKTLVAATAIEERGGWRPALLAAVVTLTHMASVLLIAAGLWLARATNYAEINRGLERAAGFVIAAVGLWRLGRHLGGFREHDGDPTAPGGRGLIGLGVAGGIVPCWDAVALIVLADAAGRLALGVVLLSAFSLGMAAVLVAVGRLVVGVRAWSGLGSENRRLDRTLGTVAALLLTAVGLYLLISGAPAG